MATDLALRCPDRVRALALLEGDALGLSPAGLESTGVGLLVRSFRLAADRGFGLVASGPQVHRVLDLIGIPQHLPTYDTRLDAIGALA